MTNSFLKHPTYIFERKKKNTKISKLSIYTYQFAREKPSEFGDLRKIEEIAPLCLRRKAINEIHAAAPRNTKNPNNSPFTSERKKSNNIYP